jgi:hypothetical protein
MNRQNRYAHKILNIEKARRGNRCQVKGCKSRRALEFHHVQETSLAGRGRGLARRALDVRKNPGSYILVCRKHHVKFHPDYFLDADKKRKYRPRKFYIVYPDQYFISGPGSMVTSPEKMVTTGGVTSICTPIPARGEK